MAATGGVLDRVAEIIRKQFNQPGIAITGKTVSYDVDGWDSISHTALILQIEREFGTEIPIEAALGFENVQELVGWLETNAASSRTG